MPIPYLTVKDPRTTIALYEEALGAKTTFVMDGPDGSVMHAEIEIEGERIMLSGEWPGMSEAPKGRSPVNFMLYVENADRALNKAVAAGMSQSGEPEDMFWGDRIAKVTDKDGYEWTFAHQTEEVSEEELKKRAAEWASANA